MSKKNQVNWDDKQDVLDAVSDNGFALEYASDRLKDDKDIVLTAVKEDSWALQYASKRLRSDIDFCKKCASIDNGCVNFFTGSVEELFRRNNFLLELVEQEENKVLLAKLKQVNKPKQNLFKRKLFP